MTMCPNSKAACECQPQDGVMCPHGPTPPFQPWKETCRVCGGGGLLRSGDSCFGCGGEGTYTRGGPAAETQQEKKP